MEFVRICIHRLSSERGSDARGVPWQDDPKVTGERQRTCAQRGEPLRGSENVHSSALTARLPALGFT